MQRQLRIGLDARLLGKRRGIGNYVKNFLDAVVGTDTQNQFFLYADSWDVLSAIPRDGRFTIRIVPPRFYPFWEQVTLPLCASSDNLDILHCPANAGPLLLSKRIALVVTVHDVMYMLPRSQLPVSPSLYQRLGRRYLRWVVPCVAKRSAAIITISNYSAADIKRHIHLGDAPIEVIHEAAGNAFKQIPEKEVANRLRRFPVGAPFFVALGAVDPRKNTTSIIQAFSRLIQRGNNDHKLVIIGLSDGAKTHFSKLITSLALETRVILLGFVTEDELVAFYNAAVAVLYPSMYEGFGLPILEAMACGTPVIGSTSASIPEIAGNAALLVDPTDPEILVEAIERILTTPSLRIDMIERGLVQVGNFSWTRLARETLEVYSHVSASQRLGGASLAL